MEGSLLLQLKTLRVWVSYNVHLKKQHTSNIFPNVRRIYEPIFHDKTDFFSQNLVDFSKFWLISRKSEIKGQNCELKTSIVISQRRLDFNHINVD